MKMRKDSSEMAYLHDGTDEAIEPAPPTLPSARVTTAWEAPGDEIPATEPLSTPVDAGPITHRRRGRARVPRCDWA